MYHNCSFSAIYSRQADSGQLAESIGTADSLCKPRYMISYSLCQSSGVSCSCKLRSNCFMMCQGKQIRLGCKCYTCSLAELQSLTEGTLVYN